MITHRTPGSLRHGPTPVGTCGRREAGVNGSGQGVVGVGGGLRGLAPIINSWQTPLPAWAAGAAAGKQFRIAISACPAARHVHA